MKKRTISFLLCLSFLANFNVTTAQNVIPCPQEMTVKEGRLELSSDLAFKTNLTGKELDDMVSYIKTTPLKIDYSTDSRSDRFIKMETVSDNNLGDEGYILKISPNGIEISAQTSSGLFYGLQSVLQLAEENNYNFITSIEILDKPRFEYRGLHLDESRHFSSKEFVKKQLDALARYKMNRFHWHLTDGAGWRIEIKKYPRLTNFAAWRPYETWKEWWNSDRHYCNQDDANAHGGYYTQDDIKEILDYAEKRHITIIPEIEMPGHSEEVLAAYPLLSCSNDMYKNSDFCIGKEATFDFLQDVLDEVIDLFPSHYIHIGGDEAVKSGWKTCPDCLRRMKEEGLDNIDELQSYMIHRIEQYVNSKGRDIIGWDEILEGGLAPNATVMSWRGEQGGITAAKAGHKVVMTPGEFCYLDGYQANPSTEPEAIGGYLTLEKVYSYNPIPASFNSEQAEMILGVQGNVWREYMPTLDHTEYMIYPRILAIAEVGWTMPENKNWNNFKERVNNEIPRLIDKGFNPYTLSADIETRIRIDYDKKEIKVALTCEKTGVNIHYTTDGTEPDVNSPIYKDSLTVKGTMKLSARAFADGKPVGKVLEKNIDYHKAIKKKITLKTQYSKNYPASGESTLIDGYHGGQGYNDGKWLGFLNTDVDAVIDLGEKTDISNISILGMQAKGPYVWLPKYIQVQISNDGKKFKDLDTLTHDIPTDREGVIFHNFIWKGKATARFIRIYAKAVDIDGGWIFMDEIVVK